MFTQFRLSGVGSHPDETANNRTAQVPSATFTTNSVHSEPTTANASNPTPAPPPPRARGSRGVRRPLSCATCIKKKTKCDRKLPCGSCVNRGDGVLCSFGPQGTAIRQAKEYAELRQRLKRLEEIIQEIRDAEKASASAVSNSTGGRGGNSPPTSTSGGEMRSSVPPPLSPATSSSCTLSPPGHHDEEDKDRKGAGRNGSLGGSLEYDASGSASYVDHSRWDCLLLEMGELKASIRSISTPDDDGGESPPGTDGGSGKGQPQLPTSYSIFSPPTTTDAGEFILMLPPKPLIDYLVSRYVEVFASLFHVLHEPSFREDYQAFWDSPRQVSLSWLALLFVVLGLGVMSLDDNDVVLKQHLHMSPGRGLDLNSYVKRYCDLAMRCLVTDRFMERYRLTTIQCLILLIYARNHSNDGGMSWALLGLTANLATGVGCHRDGLTLDLDPVETEQRRRCWAAILMLDALQASTFGRPSMMRSSRFETRMPLDLNDVDITRTEVRKASSRPTQMTYLNLKFKLLNITSKIYERLFGPEKVEYATIIDLDQEIRKEQETWPSRYGEGGSGLGGLGAHDQVHWYILHGHLHQMFLLLHRPFFHRGAGNHPVVSPGHSRNQCVESASVILEIYHVFNTEPKYQPYRWYTNGLATFHAFHAAVVVSIELLSLENPSFSELWTGFRRVEEYFVANSPRSSLATKVLPIVKFLQ